MGGAVNGNGAMGIICAVSNNRYGARARLTFATAAAQKNIIDRYRNEVN